MGGPIVHDKLWFHSSAQRLGDKNYSAGNYYNKLHKLDGSNLLYQPDYTRPYTPHDEGYRVAGRGT